MDGPGCGEKDPYVARLICRTGVGWSTPGCKAEAGASRSLGPGPVSTGFSVAAGAVLLLLLLVLAGWYRRCAMLRALGRTPALHEPPSAVSGDPEQPLRSSLKQRRQQRRIQRLLRLRRQRVHFNEAVDVSEYLQGVSATTLSSASEGRPATPGVQRRGRHGSLFVADSGHADTSDEDMDEAEEEGDMSESESALPPPEDNTDPAEDDKNK